MHGRMQDACWISAVHSWRGATEWHSFAPQDVRAAVQNVFRERTNLSLQLKDSKTIVGRLQFVLGAMLQALGFFIYLLIFNVSCTLAYVLLQGPMSGQSPLLPPDRKLPAVNNAECCLQVDIRKTWLLFSSIVLAFAFVFGKRNICRASGFYLVFNMLKAAGLRLPARAMSLLPSQLSRWFSRSCMGSSA